MYVSHSSWVAASLQWCILSSFSTKSHRPQFICQFLQYLCGNCSGVATHLEQTDGDGVIMTVMDPKFIHRIAPFLNRFLDLSIYAALPQPKKRKKKSFRIALTFHFHFFVKVDVRLQNIITLERRRGRCTLTCWGCWLLRTSLFYHFLWIPDMWSNPTCMLAANEWTR